MKSHTDGMRGTNGKYIVNIYMAPSILACSFSLRPIIYIGMNFSTDFTTSQIEFVFKSDGWLGRAILGLEERRVEESRGRF